MNKYYKNMILCSDLDFFCLLCEESFEDTASLEKHIRWEKHRKSVKTQTYVPKYKKDFIQKIREIHYCELCNCVINNDALQDHIKSEDHKERKTNPIVDNNNEKVTQGSRDSNGSIKFPNLTINRLQWHTVHNNKCYVCNATLENVIDHIGSTQHMINIIQNQIVENTGRYYRKVNEKFYCFVCNHIISEDSLQTHSCKKERGNKKSAKKNGTPKKTSESPGLLKLLADIEKDDYDVNVKDKTAKCKHCSAFVDATFKALSKHRELYHEETIKYVDPKDHGKLRSELAAFGRDNFIKLNESGSKGYCSLCDIFISASIKVAADHVNGVRHRGHLELKGLVARKKHSVPGCIVQPLQHFLRNLFHVNVLNTFCINFSITVSSLSFMFCADVKNEKQPKKKCLCCDMVLRSEELNEHWKTKKHRDAVIAADVLAMDGEFIRVIRPGLFHCGFCNEVFPFWETMQRHVDRWPHKVARKEHEYLLMFCLDWYSENKTNGSISISEKLYAQLIALRLVE